MRLAEDDRARVPFALVGAVLLVASATYAATLATRPAPGERPAEAAALERIDALVDAAVHRGTKRAARAAARDPVVEPADGGVLNETGTFRDYLRVRVYLAVREQLARSDVQVGAARAAASLPPTPTESALRAAKRRVGLRRVDGGLRVRIENVTVTLRRGGRVVERRPRTVERTVATPVLAVHDRVREYERRIDRGPLEGPGLGRRLTARLYAVAWARGYAQYGGAPIQNVVANRHVELMTNGALLETQRAVFGRSDPAGRRAHRNATAIVGVTDLLVPTLEEERTLREEVLKPYPRVPASTPPPSVPTPSRPPAAPDSTLAVGVNLTADRAFAAFVSGPDPPLEDVARTVYSAETRIEVATVESAGGGKPAPDPPGRNWTLARARTETSAVAVRDGDAPVPNAVAGWHRLHTYTRHVVRRHRVVRTWTRNGTGRRTTSAAWTTTLKVGIAVVGRHAPSEHAPPRGIETVHEPGGPLDGPNLAGVEAAAVERLVDERGGPDAIARRAATDDLDGATARIDAERPDGLDAWLYRDLAGLRDRVRNVTVTVRRGRAGTGRANPAATLAAALRERRGELLDAPPEYGSVAGKARIAVRAAYLEAVIGRLEERADRSRTVRSKFEGALSDAGVDPGRLTRLLASRREASDPAGEPLLPDGLSGRVEASVAGSPPYLTLSAVRHERVPAVPPGEDYYPLVAKNTNLFTVPHGDVADGIVAQLLGDSGRTNLGTAARTLQGADRALAERRDPELERRRAELRSEVAESLSYVRAELRGTLAVRTDLSRAERRAAVEAAFARWDTTAARALAAANGSAAPAVAAAAARRTEPAPSERRRDLLAVLLRVRLATALEDPRARPPTPAVHESANLTRELARQVLTDAAATGVDAAAKEIERRYGDKLVLVPAGLPLAPVPGYWYATVNVWHVAVRGEYARFAVTARAGAPGAGGTVTYERDGATVTLDWDGDGHAEALGRASRVAFAVSLPVVVVVPPGKTGVGDVDGDADERSAGWPEPGNASTVGHG